MALVSDKLYALSRLINIDLLEGALLILGPIGAVVGAFVWLIARPDRTDG
jgi:hypothetical protein